MRKERLVTRTMNVKDCNTMTVRLSDASVQNVLYTIVNVEDGKELEVLKKQHEDSDVKIVAVTGMSKREVLYGMEESTFLKYARVLPPRTTKEE